MPEATIALKFDSNKVPLSLLPTEPLMQIGDIFGFGQAKYTQLELSTIQSCFPSIWNVQIANTIERLELEDCVEAVMKDTCLIRILSVKQKSLKQLEDGKSLTKTSFLNSIGIENQAEGKTQSTKSKEEITTMLLGMASQQRSLIEERQRVVNFVVNGKPLCTQTIVIQLENFEVSFAVSAITGLDSSMTVLKCLEKLSGTSIGNKSSMLKTGAWNWTNGFEWSRLIDSSLRHLLAWKAGENCDPESGKSHLAHLGCNVLMLLWHEVHKKELDNRGQ